MRSILTGPRALVAFSERDMDIPKWAAGKFKVNPETKCWEWVGVRAASKSYPTITVNQKEVRGNRLMLEAKLGRNLGPSEHALHKCDCKSCINPSHLYAGTHAKNMRDASVRGLLPAGENAPRAKLTNAQAMEIKHTYSLGGITIREIARRYGLSDVAVRNLLIGKTWKRALAAACEAIAKETT